ncbi:MAG: hypothetical protein WC408_00980 [Candidatus Micrarchaeia archaeon]|jgi:hypothetical protein
MIQNEMGFDIQWEYVFMLGGILLIVVAFVYVLYNTTSSVRDAVHKNFGGNSQTTYEADTVAATPTPKPWKINKGSISGLLDALGT